MCTVTVVPHEDGIRVAFNRDERRDRPDARPPKMHWLANRTATFPIDPVGAGTWIGVNDGGLVAALLNRTLNRSAKRRERPHVSRGAIVPAVLDCASLAAAADAMNAVDPARFDRFRLLVIHGHRGCIFASDGSRISSEDVDVLQPLILTSSSLGDRLVSGPRTRLFRALVEAHGNELSLAQRRFHDHQWPLRKDISVRMERSDARTVSRTIVDVGPGATRLDYQPLRELTLSRAA